jgi:CxxC motif-containing protein
MEKRELTCIQCPMGCAITVGLDRGEVVNISGYTCNRGKIYAGKEVTNPTRTVTSSVHVTGSGAETMVSVKTRTDIPKEKVFDCVRALKGVTIAAPVHIGDVVLANVAGTGVDVIATKNA